MIPVEDKGHSNCNIVLVIYQNILKVSIVNSQPSRPVIYFQQVEFVIAIKCLEHKDHVNMSQDQKFLFPCQFFPFLKSFGSYYDRSIHS